MLCLSKVALEAARNPNLSEAVQYAAQRLAEALDPGVSFTRSAAYITPPDTSLSELRDLVDPFASGSARPYRPEVNRASGYTRSLVRLDRDVHAWYPQQYQAFVDAARDLQQATNDAVARQVASGSLLPAIDQLLRAMQGAPTYRDRILSAVVSACTGPPPPDLRSWSAFDYRLLRLAAIVLDEGRHGTTTAASLADSLRNAETNGNALDLLQDVLRSPERSFAVALVLDGLASFSSAPPPDVQLVQRAEGWPGGTAPPTADESLRAFSTLHIDQRRCVVAIEVSAYDAGDAHERALARLRPLRNQVAALHGNRIVVPDEALVLDRDIGQTTLRHPRQPPVASAQLMAPPADEVLAEAMHYHALGSAERVSVMAVVYAFIALENLSAGAETTSNGVPTGQPRAAASFLPPTSRRSPH